MSLKHSCGIEPARIVLLTNLIDINVKYINRNNPSPIQDTKRRKSIDSTEIDRSNIHALMAENSTRQISQPLNLSERQARYARSHLFTRGKSRCCRKRVIFDEKRVEIVNWVLSNGSYRHTKLNEITKVAPEIKLGIARLEAVRSTLKRNNFGRRVA